MKTDLFQSCGHCWVFQICWHIECSTLATYFFRIWNSSIGITSWQTDGETMERVTDFIFLGSKITVDGDCSHEIKKHLLLGRKAMTNLNSILKIRDITLSVSLGPFSQSYGFSSCHVCMWELYHKESWVPKNLYFWTVLLETLESPLDCKEIKPINPKGNQSWIFFGRTDAEAEAPILWSPDAKNWLIGKDPVAGKDLRQEEKGTTEDEMFWMTPSTQWTWVWTSFRSWWWIRKPSVLQAMGLQS